MYVIIVILVTGITVISLNNNNNTYEYATIVAITILYLSKPCASSRAGRARSAQFDPYLPSPTSARLLL
eukprot:546993-Rhodomonas_salina.1